MSEMTNLINAALAAKRASDSRPSREEIAARIGLALAPKEAAVEGADLLAAGAGGALGYALSSDRRDAIRNALLGALGVAGGRRALMAMQGRGGIQGGGGAHPTLDILSAHRAHPDAAKATGEEAERQARLAATRRDQVRKQLQEIGVIPMDTPAAAQSIDWGKYALPDNGKTQPKATPGPANGTPAPVKRSAYLYGGDRARQQAAMDEMNKANKTLGALKDVATGTPTALGQGWPTASR